MDYHRFLSSLFEDGRVSVAEPAPLSEREVNAGDEFLRDSERHYRLEMPCEAPAFSLAAARWAGTRFYRACQCVVYRDVGKEVLDRELGEPFGGSASPGVHYSVDLVFRYLPDLLRLARSAAEKDPLVEHLQRWSRQWPLSSVGVPGVADVDVDGFAHCPSLLRLYADRIIAGNDRSRLADPLVREAVRSALGMYPNLASIATVLEDDSVEGTIT